MSEHETQERQAVEPEQHAASVRQMFDRISPTYDRLNRALSWGIDRRWRGQAASRLVERLDGNGPGPVLDICAGTLELGRAVQQALRERGVGQRRVVAADFSREMLLAARGGAAREGEAGMDVLQCDALCLPFKEDSFAGAICGFGLRNLSDPRAGLQELGRVLRPGGALVVLEFCRPTRIDSRAFHALYGRLLFPLAGAAVAGDAGAYRYLSRTMRGFWSRGELEEAVRGAGFEAVQGSDLTLGVASIVCGEKR